MSNSVKDENKRKEFLLDMLKDPVSVWIGDDVTTAVSSPEVRYAFFASCFVLKNEWHRGVSDVLVIRVRTLLTNQEIFFIQASHLIGLTELLREDYANPRYPICSIFCRMYQRSKD